MEVSWGPGSEKANNWRWLPSMLLVDSLSLSWFNSERLGSRVDDDVDDDDDDDDDKNGGNNDGDILRDVVCNFQR